MNGTAARVREMVRKEFRQVFRDPRMKRVILVAPILQLLVFGYAVSTDVRHTPLLICDQDGTASARELADAFTSGGYFDVVSRTRRAADVVTAMNRGTAIAALVVPVGFERDLAGGRAQVQLVFDGTNSNTATVAKGYAERIVSTFAETHAGFTRPVCSVDGSKYGDTWNVSTPN